MATSVRYRKNLLYDGSGDILSNLGGKVINIASKAIAKLLLDYGASPNVTVDNDKSLPVLTVFVKQNDIEALSLLLSYGANVNAKDLFGRSCIDFAISESNIEMIDLLLKHGAESYYPKS